MFDLEQAISKWRRQLIAGGIPARTTLDELEAHLRDDVERRVASGLAMPQAFAIAVHQLGSTAMLAPEFEKVGTDMTVRPVTGIILGCGAIGVAVLGIYLFLALPRNSSLPFLPDTQMLLWPQLCVLALLLSIPTALAWIGYQVGLWRVLAEGGFRRTRLENGVLVATALALLTGVFLAVANTNSVWALVGVPITLVAAIATGLLVGLRRHFRPVREIVITAQIFPITVFAAMAWIWYVFAGPGYYAEFNHIKSAFAAMSGVEVVEMYGNLDITYENIWAHVRVKDKGDIEFFNLTEDPFTNTPQIQLGRIGPYTIRVERWGYHGVFNPNGSPVRSRSVGSTLDVGVQGAFGPQGRFAGRLPFELRKVPDVVDRYDEICDVLGEMADHQDALRFDAPDGSFVHYTFRQ